jgi:AraC-like DNA-binding protein
MHMVFRLSGPALRVYSGAEDAIGSCIAVPVLGGARTSFYVKDVAGPVVSVGVQLLPGAAQALFGVSAAELAGRHTPLPDLWGPRSDSLLEQLAEEPNPQCALARLESLLAPHFLSKPELNPIVVSALKQCSHVARIEEMVHGSGYSHRGLIALFRHATGMSMKRYARLMRFQRLLAALGNNPAMPLIALALDAGYSDQAHMTREFREFAGVTPSQYRLTAPVSANHVKL